MKKRWALSSRLSVCLWIALPPGQRLPSVSFCTGIGRYLIRLQEKIEIEGERKWTRRKERGSDTDRREIFAGSMLKQRFSLSVCPSIYI